MTRILVDEDQGISAPVRVAPKVVLSVRLGGVTVKDEILRPSNIFVSLYILVFVVSSLLLGIISFGD